MKRAFLFLFSSAMCCSVFGLNNSSSIYERVVSQESSLVAWYKMNNRSGETSLLEYKSGSNAPISGTPTLAQTSLMPYPKGNLSVLFNGTDSKATVPASVIDFERTDDFTVEFVIKPNVTRSGSGVGSAVLSNINSSSPFPGYGVELLYNDAAAANKTVLTVFLISNFGSNNRLWAIGSTDLANGTTYHIVVTYDGSSTFAGIKAYINGIPETLTNKGGTLSASIDSPLQPTIGARTASLFLNGNLEMLSVYNAVLSDLRIVTHWTAFRNIHLGGFFQSMNSPFGPTPVSFILDTDLASDADDVGDLAVANYLDTAGELNILAVVTSSANPYSAPAAAVFNSYLGNGSIPVGAWMGSTPSGAPSASLYASNIVQLFGTPGDSRTNYTDSTVAYRTALAGSTYPVTICAVGFFGALSNLLVSAADGISSLNGVQLVSGKVGQLVVVAGNYPGGNEFNFVSDSASANYVFSNWPTKIVAVPIALGDTIKSGPPSGANPATNPIKKAYDLFGIDPREAWGQLGVLYSARAASSYFSIPFMYGTNYVNSSNGTNLWSQILPVRVSYFGKIASDVTFSNLFNGMFTE